VIISEKLKKLRQLMRQVGIDYYLIPSSDQHQNEYVPTCWQRRRWISGFTGSAGDVIVGLDKAFLWTDARYFIQAKRQLDQASFEMIPAVQGSCSAINEWLHTYAKGKKLGVDPCLIPCKIANALDALLQDIGGKLVSLVNNFVDQVWVDQPQPNLANIEIIPVAFSGQSVGEKLKILRKTMHEKRCDAHVVTMLDSIAWLYNIRGRDVAYNPLVISYAIVTQDGAQLFIDQSRLTSGCIKALNQEGIVIAAYGNFAQALHDLKGSILIDPLHTSWWVQQQIYQASVKFMDSPISLMKACKNAVEVDNMREVHRLDGIAIVKFIIWLQSQGLEGFDEVDMADKLDSFRSLNDKYIGKSFETISAFGPNGAICHYAPEKQTALTITDDSLYLLDSGGQYYYGTTDITRTFHLGVPTTEQMQHYTLVLKGHLALRRTIFPHGARGEHLDAIARQALWLHKLNYGHGTGHGVGAYLCVHEGPQRIASGATSSPLLNGMIVSNEPGVYFADQYGIRIENLCLIKQVAEVSESQTNDGPFYGFEDLTLVPYERKLIDVSMLSEDEIVMVNQYHERVKRCLYDALSQEEQAWLEDATKPF